MKKSNESFIKESSNNYTLDQKLTEMRIIDEQTKENYEELLQNKISH